MRAKLLPVATTALEGAPGLAAHMQKRHQILRHGSAQVVRVGLERTLGFNPFSCFAPSTR